MTDLVILLLVAGPVAAGAAAASLSDCRGWSSSSWWGAAGGAAYGGMLIATGTLLFSVPLGAAGGLVWAVVKGRTAEPADWSRAFPAMPGKPPDRPRKT